MGGREEGKELEQEGCVWSYGKDAKDLEDIGDAVRDSDWFCSGANRSVLRGPFSCVHSFRIFG